VFLQLSDGGPQRELRQWLEKGVGLAIGQLNRRQNTATVFIADPRSGVAKAVFQDQDAAWVDVPESGGPGRDTGGFDWLNHGKSFLWLSERYGWRQAYSVPSDGGEPVRITLS
jgi:dipeptidyl-peptidase-4